MRQEQFELANDGGTIELVLREPLDAVAAHEAGLLQKREVPGHHRPILDEVLGDLLDVRTAFLQQDQNDLLANWLRNGLEEVRIERTGQRFDGVVLGPL